MCSGAAQRGSLFTMYMYLSEHQAGGVQHISDVSCAPVHHQNCFCVNHARSRSG